MIRPNRQQRRQRRHQIKELTDRAKRLHDELLANDAVIAGAKDRIASSTTDIVAMIDEYVDMVAKVVDLDDSQEFGEDEKIYETMVQVRWCGVETAEQARDAMTEEVARRSVGKTDLSLLLTSIDHTALGLYGDLPDALWSLHGETLVEAAVQRLHLEDFAATLVGDERWVTMRERWARLGWRGTNAETFNDAFLRAVVERVATLHDAHGADNSIVSFGDTVLDEQLKKARPELRKQMIQAFKERLDREFNLLSSRRTDPMDRVGATITEISEKDLSDGKVEFTLDLDADEARRLDAVADRWDTTREGAMDRIIHEAVEVDARRVLALIGIAKDGPVVITPKAPDTGDFVYEGDWWNDSIPYSDHELMRRGRMLWEGSYAKGMTDEEVRRDVVQSDAGFPAELVHFSAKWAVHAFQRLMTSHTFAAALMCSDVQRDVLMGIEKQWDAFLVIVPNGMLVADRFEFTRVAVATYSFGVRMMLITADPLSTHRRSPVGLVEEAPTLPDLLVSDEADLVAESQAARCFVLARRLVAGLLLNLQHEPNFKIKAVEAKPKKKGREAEPEHRIVTIGKPLEIDCRDSVKEYVEHGKTGRKHGPPTVQVMVRGHYRRQVCGVGRMDRKVIWIEPFWRGPEAALIQTRPKKAAP